MKKRIVNFNNFLIMTFSKIVSQTSYEKCFFVKCFILLFNYYTIINHNGYCFKGGSGNYIVVTKFGTRWVNDNKNHRSTVEEAKVKPSFR